MIERQNDEEKLGVMPRQLREHTDGCDCALTRSSEEGKEKEALVQESWFTYDSEDCIARERERERQRTIFGDRVSNA